MEEKECVLLPGIFKKMAAYELLLRLCSETDTLTICALSREIDDLMQGIKKQGVINKKATRKQEGMGKKIDLPPRLKKRLVGELVLSFDRDFPLIQARLSEVDRHLTRIVSEVLLLMENLNELPERVREVVWRVISDGDGEVREAMEKLYQEGSVHYREWLSAALKLVQKKVDTITKTLKALSEGVEEKE